MKLVPALVAAVSGILLCAQAPIDFSPDIKGALSLFEEGAYLKAHDALFEAAFDANGQVRDPVSFQMWAQFSPFVTNELDLDVMERSGHASTLDTTSATRLAGATPRDAIEEIVTRARETSIVILNEEHASPRDRAFALQVARALRPLGYKTLAVEAIDNNEPKTGLSATEQLKRDGFVRLSTGVYTRDPVFSRFLREALALGYEPVAYEQTKAQTKPNDGINEREEAQAENLMQGIFRTRPQEKVLIYVGRGHVAEKSGKRSEWMAARLKRMTGIDPLTIDQTRITDTSSASGTYMVASERIGRNPAVFFEGARPLVLGNYAGFVDLQIIHPRRTYRSGRPTWFVELGGKQMPIPRHLLPAHGRRLIQVFAADAPDDAVPLDQVLVIGPSSNAVLIVPDGPVRFATQE